MILIVLAPLIGGLGTYITMKAIEARSCMLGLVGSVVSLLGGICIGCIALALGVEP